MGDWKERSVKRRDDRQAKAPEIRAPGRSNKDTKRWCRGKVGREHKPECVDYNKWKNQASNFATGWKVLLCSECGKELDYYWPAPWGKTKSIPPDWAIPSLPKPESTQ